MKNQNDTPTKEVPHLSLQDIAANNNDVHCAALEVVQELDRTGVLHALHWSVGKGNNSDWVVFDREGEQMFFYNQIVDAAIKLVLMECPDDILSVLGYPDITVEEPIEVGCG